MRNKQWLYVTAVVFLTMMSCSLNICGYRQGYVREQLSDTSWIAQTGDTYSFWSREGNVLTDNAALRFSRFFGKETLWTIKVQQEGYLNIASSINSAQGPFELVLVQTTTKQVIRVAKQQGSANGRYYLERGTYAIKILGYDAKGSIAITLCYPQGMTSNVSTMRF